MQNPNEAIGYNAVNPHHQEYISRQRKTKRKPYRFKKMKFQKIQTEITNKPRH